MNLFCLEDYFGSELEFPRGCSLGGGCASRGGGCCGCAGSPGKDHVIDVECFRAEFEADVLVERSVFDHREVEVVEVGLAKDHLAHVAVVCNGDGEDRRVVHAVAGGTARADRYAATGALE